MRISHLSNARRTPAQWLVEESGHRATAGYDREHSPAHGGPMQHVLVVEVGSSPEIEPLSPHPYSRMSKIYSPHICAYMYIVVANLSCPFSSFGLIFTRALFHPFGMGRSCPVEWDVARTSLCRFGAIVSPSCRGSDRLICMHFLLKSNSSQLIISLPETLRSDGCATI